MYHAKDQIRWIGSNLLGIIARLTNLEVGAFEEHTFLFGLGYEDVVVVSSYFYTTIIKIIFVMSLDVIIIVMSSRSEPS